MMARTFLHGAHYQNNQTRFALWAPDAKNVSVIFSSNEVHEMESSPRGWFSTVLNCPPDTRYCYLIDNSVKVPDPASHAQVRGVHGLSYVVDHQAYSWKNSNWNGRPWHEAIIYEVHVGLYGGFAKLEAHLPQLVDLGITAIELMPLGEFPGARNWGYDGALIFAPDSSYGTPDELKSLIDTAHGLGLMVYLDVVYNHFGPDGNFLGQYASSFFRDDIHTPWGSAIDFRLREVRDFFCENALMWLQDYRFDGLRFDAVHAISEKDFLVEMAERVRGTIGPTRHIHLMLENEDNTTHLLEEGFDAQWNDDGHNILHVLLTDEHEGYYADFVDTPASKLARCLNQGFVFQGETSHRGHSRGEPSAHLPPTAFILFLQNHDQVGNRAFGERLPLLTNPDALKAAVALLLLSPMIPLLFMGEEWGSKQPFLYFTDHNPELAKAVCEGRRNEFAAFTKFADPAVRDEIPDPNEPDTFAQCALDPDLHQSHEHRAWREYYQGLLSLRKMHITPHLPTTSSEQATILAPKAVSASWRLGSERLLRIDINLGDQQTSVGTLWNTERIIFSHHLKDADFVQGILPPHSIVVTLDDVARDKLAIDGGLTKSALNKTSGATIGLQREVNNRGWES